MSVTNAATGTVGVAGTGLTGIAASRADVQRRSVLGDDHLRRGGSHFVEHAIGNANVPGLRIAAPLICTGAGEVGDSTRRPNGRDLCCGQGMAAVVRQVFEAVLLV